MQLLMKDAPNVHYALCFVSFRLLYATDEADRYQPANGLYK